MPDPLIRVEGGAALRRTLKAAGRDLDDLKDANARAASVVAQWAAVTAPRRTGALGASVRGSRQAGRARIVAGNAGVPYAGVIHWGWPSRHITAQPFISAAAQSTEPSWTSAYLADIEKVIATVKGA